MDEFHDIIESDLPEIDKLAQAFKWVMGRMIECTEREVELARAMQDRESVVKTQIKLETMKFATNALHDCYRRITGRKAWDE